MKPAKKQNSSKNPKKPVNDNNSGSGIKVFFKTAPKSFVVDQNVKEPVAMTSKDAIKEFYRDMLKEKLAGKTFLLVILAMNVV